MTEFSADSLSDAISAVFGSTDNASALQISDSAGVIRVTLGSLGNGDYGLKVISTDGTTVIIDGTSDVFKIAATGTLSKAVVNLDNSVTSSAALSGLGTYTTTPAHLAHTSLDNVNTGHRRAAAFVAINGIAGGAISSSIGWYFATFLDGSSFANVILVVTDANAGNQTVWVKYYILEEAAL